MIGTATSDDDGAYSIPLPGPGQYTATLDPDTLPKGVTLTDPTKTTLTFTVRPAQQKPLLFPFGKDTREVSGTTDRIIPLLIEGFRLGLIIAMTAIGLSLIYGTTKFTNFAHGEMVTFGALVAFFLNQTLGLQLSSSPRSSRSSSRVPSEPGSRWDCGDRCVAGARRCSG